MEDPTSPKLSSEEANATSLSLLLKVRQNDAQAWNRLIQLYRPLVSFWCQRNGTHLNDVEDITQDVFHAASKGLANFRKEKPGDTFRGWLRGVTRNVVLMHLRKRGEEPRGGGGTDAYLQMQAVRDPMPADDEEDPPSQVNDLYYRALEMVKGEFEQRTWQSFWLTTVENQTPTEVAQLMGISPAAVRQAKSRILRRLKEEVGDVIQ